MKKMIVLILSVIMFVGCSSKPTEKNSMKDTGAVEESNKEVTDEKKDKEETNENKKNEESKTVELNHDELIKGDFSSIAGEYVNYEGDVVAINNEGLRTDIDEKTHGEVTYLESSLIYQRPLWVGDGPLGGYTMTVYPVGTAIEGLDTDRTKIRISYGQDAPISLEDIYTKK